MQLSELSVNRKGKIISLTNSNGTKSALKRLGLTEGSDIKVIRYSPFGDALQIKIKEFYLAIRKSDADKIKVEEV